MSTMEVLVEEPENREAYIKMAGYALIKHTDMSAEMRAEAVEICTSAVEKFPTDTEKSSKQIKELMDRKFGKPWNVALGESFSCLLYTSPSPRDLSTSRMPSSA